MFLAQLRYNYSYTQWLSTQLPCLLWTDIIISEVVFWRWIFNLVKPRSARWHLWSTAIEHHQPGILPLMSRTICEQLSTSCLHLGVFLLPPHPPLYPPHTRSPLPKIDPHQTCCNYQPKVIITIPITSWKQMQLMITIFQNQKDSRCDNFWPQNIMIMIKY